MARKSSVAKKPATGFALYFRQHKTAAKKGATFQEKFSHNTHEMKRLGAAWRKLSESAKQAYHGGAHSRKSSTTKKRKPSRKSSAAKKQKAADIKNIKKDGVAKTAAAQKKRDSAAVSRTRVQKK